MPGVLEKQSDQPSAESSEVKLADKNEATVFLNEQTNYVPKRTIITVGQTSKHRKYAIGTLIVTLFLSDLSGMFQRRLAGFDRPDNAGI